MKHKLCVAAAMLVGVGAVAVPAQAASSPAVVTGGTNKVAQMSAVIQGTVNPNGSSTTYSFQWGLTTAYGFGSVPHSAGRGTRPEAVAAPLAGLTPGTVYHYRLIASNKFGTSVGADHSLRTAGHPPAEVATGPVTQIAATTATLTGVIVTNDEATSWVFQYGVSPALGFQTFGQTLPASAAPQSVASGLTGLTPGTIFYYRLVGVHDATVVTYGSEGFFMTFPLTRPVPGVTAATTPHRARSKPFVFTTSGTVHLPGSIPSWAGCNGTATIRYFLGRRVVAATAAAVQPNCTFAGQVSFARKPGRGPRKRIVQLYAFIHFTGNGYLAPKHARVERVTLG